MEDIAPGLLKKLQDAFAQNVENNMRVWTLYQMVQDGSATYAEADEFAYEVGEALAQAFKKHLSSANLPDGKLYFNIADRVIRPLLEADRAMIEDVVIRVQTALNKKAGLGLKAQTASIDVERVDAIINRACSSEQFDDVSWILHAPVVQFSQLVVEDILRANVDFHGKVGLSPKIVRKSERNCCKWCKGLAGEYKYPDIPRDVYRRHENCRCTVLYDPADGSKQMQNVHTKKWTQSEDDARIESRKVIGLRVNGKSIKNVSSHALDQMTARNVTIESVKDAIERPLQIKPVKYDSLGRPSITIIGRKATITMNPNTGTLTTMYPTHSKTARKLSGKG